MNYLINQLIEEFNDDGLMNLFRKLLNSKESICLMK